MAKTVDEIKVQQDKLKEMKTPDGLYKCQESTCSKRKPYITIGR